MSLVAALSCEQSASCEPRKKSKPLLLSSEQEDDLVEWLKENPCLFIKKLNKMVALWQEKGAEMCVEVALLKTWFESMRTRFGKLTKSKSGDGNIDHTERDQ